MNRGNALILQGWYQKPTDNWYPWLKKELHERGFKVFLPDLPTMHTDLPDMSQQLTYIDGLHSIADDTIVIGHSLGSLLAMRLAERFVYKKMFLIAGWDFNDLTEEHTLFWKHAINHKKIKKNISEIYCISSDNDPYMTVFTVQEMSKRLGGTCILVSDAGHFTGKDGITQIPAILPYISKEK